MISLLTFLPNLVLSFAAQPDVKREVLTGWMLLVAALSGLVGYLLSGVMLQPLSRLETEVQGGNFTQQHADDPTEIRSLRRAFTGLLERLRTEQGRRNAFMATLVHDLKTPLIATGHLTRLLAGGQLPETDREAVTRELLDENARLLALVGQMADAHRFEREDVRLSPQPTDLRSLIDTVARRLLGQAQVRGLNLEVTGMGTAPADPKVLERAVTNLTENALRYARSRVELAVTGAGVEVRDDGPGLGAPIEELAQPFNAQPATIAGQQYTAGTTGLGLFIVRRITEAHGGSLTYTRTPPPHPLSVFALNLPEVLP